MIQIRIMGRDGPKPKGRKRARQLAHNAAREEARHRAGHGTRKAARKPTPKRAKKATPKISRARAMDETALAALAHDIRTPLTGILALAELLAASDLPDRERGWADAILSAAQHLAQSTSLVLDAVKADATGLTLRRDWFSPRRLAETVAASLSARAATNGLSADSRIANDIPESAIGDAVRIRSALENLIDNAVKFTARGDIRFEASAKPATRRRIRLIFRVTDSGVGLTASEIRNLFRPFAQANDKVSQQYGGTGLGLVLVKRVANAMGGDLSVTSRKDAGAVFTLETLVEAAPSSADIEREAGPSALTSPALKILCVEDNPFGRVVMNALLTELGHRIDFAGSGEAAIAAVARGGYDLVLMDVTLPGIDGLEATRQIRALRGDAARIPIIGMSALSSAGDIERAKAAGMNDYLVKPVNAALLMQALASALTQSTVQATGHATADAAS